MTSRQRLLTALRHGQPDRVPVTIYEYCPYSDEWPAGEPSYAPLLELERTLGDSLTFVPAEFPVFYSYSRDVRRSDQRQPDGSVILARRIDTPAGQLTSVFRRDPGLMTAWQVEPLIKDEADIERLLSLPEPQLTVDADRLHALERRMGDRGVMCVNPGDALGNIVGLFDFEDFVLRCSRDDAPVRALLDRAQQRLLRAVRAWGAVLSDTVFRLYGPEYCGAPLMNPARFFQRYVVEPDRELTEAIHQSGNFSVIHCHGRLRGLLDMIADTGADALEPIETLPLSTADVTLAEVKRRIGRRMCLMGAVQARTLECGTTEQMRDEVRSAIADAAPGGGFVLLPTAAPFMLPLDPVCLENARAMYEAAHEFGRYGP